ncbi:MAG: amidohydrolase family protein [Acidobacteriota bacterium]
MMQRSSWAARAWLRRLLPMLVGSVLMAAPGKQVPNAAAERLVLVNASVVDVVDGSIRRGATVTIGGGRIEAVGGQAPAGVPTLDLGGRFVVPGLIDAHVHIASTRALRTALDSGVTTVRSSGVSHYADVGLRDLVKQGALAGPDVVASGYHVRPFIAEEAFFDHPALSGLMRSGVTTPDALRRVVQANLSRGVDWIKVLATERAGTPETDPRKQVYTEAELRIVVEEAATQGIPVQAHAHGAEGALAAVRAGVRSIEHGTYLTDEALQLMAKQGTFFDPTMEAVIDVSQVGGDYDNRDLQLRGRHMLPRLRETIARASKMGVKLVAGSDTGYGPTSVGRLSIEVVNLVESGLTPLGALQAATVVNAQMLMRDRQIGQVAPGFEADLLVVERHPLEHLGTLQDPLLVISNGRVAVNRLTFGK